MLQKLYPSIMHVHYTPYRKRLVHTAPRLTLEHIPVQGHPEWVPDSHPSPAPCTDWTPAEYVHVHLRCDKKDWEVVHRSL